MVLISGAGPSGSYLAYLLAKKGFKVRVLEEHDKIGKPVQCTGVVTKAIDDVLKIDSSIIVNKIQKVRVNFKKDFLEIDLGEGDYILDRCKFDNFLGEMAESEGAKILFGNRLNRAMLKENIWCDTNKGELQDDILVGADGPYTRVGNSFGMLKSRKYKTAMQYRVKGEFEEGVYSVYLGFGEFGWVVPENNKIAMVGVVGNENLSGNFGGLLKLINAKKIMENQTGMIPLYNPRIPLSYENKIFLTGDAAGLVKASTHGGLVYGLNASKILAGVIENGGNYDKEIKKKIGKELWIGLKVRQIMGYFNDSDYEYLMKLFKEEKVLELMKKYNRDFPSKFLFKLILKEPRFLRFLKLVVI